MTANLEPAWFICPGRSIGLYEISIDEHTADRESFVTTSIHVRDGLLASQASVEAADGSTLETALPLRAEQSGSIPGGPNGHFTYFSFVYPGGWPVHLDLQPNTDDKLVLRYVGYKVYGPEPNREYVDGRLDENEVWQGGRELMSDDQGVYYVQVYNYNPNPGTVLNFTLLAGDLPPTRRAAPGNRRASRAMAGPPMPDRRARRTPRAAGRPAHESPPAPATTAGRSRAR